MRHLNYLKRIQGWDKCEITISNPYIRGRIDTQHQVIIAGEENILRYI